LVDKQLELCAKIVKEARGLRRAGAAALDLCFVACGSFDVFWEKNLKPWDTAAGSLIAQEAGAVISNLSGESFKVEMPHIVAGTPKMHAELLKLYREINS
jgi:myo-inositol-1(or 4)-monophosphatase